MTENNFEEWPAYRKKPGKINKKIAAVGLATALTVGYAGLKTLDHYNEPHGTPYQAFSAHEISNIEFWQQQINDQISSGGQLELADLKINVNSGVLNGRYSPVVRENDDTTHGNIAVEFKPGALFEIDDAIIIHGRTADPNDPNGDRWAWINGNSLGLKYDIFINIGSQTEEKITVKERRFVDFSRINTKGDVYYIDSNGQELLVPQSIQQPQPATTTSPIT